MPQDYYSPYQEAAAGFERLGQVLPQIALGMAQRRYQQDLMRYQMDLKQRELASQMAVDRERVNLLRQQAKNESSQTAALDREAEVRGQLGNAMRVMPLYHPSATGAINNNIGEILSGIAQLKGADTTGLPEKAAQMMQFNNPASTRMMALGQKPIMEVSSGASLVDVENEVPLYHSPRVLGQGQTLVPGQGGEALATGLPPRSPQSTLGQFLGPLINLRGQGMMQGLPINPNNQTFQQAEGAISQILPQVLQQAGVTNVAPQQIQQAGSPATQGPDKNAARMEALELIKAHPAKADAIRKRYRETFNEDLK